MMLCNECCVILLKPSLFFVFSVTHTLSCLHSHSFAHSFIPLLSPSPALYHIVVIDTTGMQCAELKVGDFVKIFDEEVFPADVLLIASGSDDGGEKER